MSTSERKYLIREGHLFGSVATLIFYNINPMIAAVWVAVIMVLWVKSFIQQGHGEQIETVEVPQ